MAEIDGGYLRQRMTAMAVAVWNSTADTAANVGDGKRRRHKSAPAFAIVVIGIVHATINHDKGDGGDDDDVEGWADNLSWECLQHVGNMSATCQNVAHFGQKCVSEPTQISHQHTIFVSGMLDVWERQVGA